MPYHFVIQKQTDRCVPVGVTETCIESDQMLRVWRGSKPGGRGKGQAERREAFQGQPP